MIKFLLQILCAVVLYGILRHVSVGLETKQIEAAAPCSTAQKIIDTVISRECSVLL